MIVDKSHLIPIVQKWEQYKDELVFNVYFNTETSELKVETCSFDPRPKHPTR